MGVAGKNTMMWLVFCVSILLYIPVCDGTLNSHDNETPVGPSQHDSETPLGPSQHDSGPNPDSIPLDQQNVTSDEMIQGDIEDIGSIEDIGNVESQLLPPGAQINIGSPSGLQPVSDIIDTPDLNSPNFSGHQGTDVLPNRDPDLGLNDSATAFPQSDLLNSHVTPAIGTQIQPVLPQTQTTERFDPILTQRPTGNPPLAIPVDSGFHPSTHNYSSSTSTEIPYSTRTVRPLNPHDNETFMRNRTTTVFAPTNSTNRFLQEQIPDISHLRTVLPSVALPTTAVNEVSSSLPGQQERSELITTSGTPSTLSLDGSLDVTISGLISTLKAEDKSGHKFGNRSSTSVSVSGTSRTVTHLPNITMSASSNSTSAAQVSSPETAEQSSSASLLSTSTSTILTNSNPIQTSTVTVPTITPVTQRTTHSPFTSTPLRTTQGQVTMAPQRTTHGSVTTAPQRTTHEPVTTSAQRTTHGPVTTASQRTTHVPVTTTSRRTTHVPVTTAPRRTTHGSVTTAPRRTTHVPVTTAPRRTTHGPVTTASRRTTHVPVTTAPPQTTHGSVTTAPRRTTHGPVTTASRRTTHGSVTTAPRRTTHGPVTTEPRRTTHGPVTTASRRTTYGPVTTASQRTTNGPVITHAIVLTELTIRSSNPFNTNTQSSLSTRTSPSESPSLVTISNTTNSLTDSLAGFSQVGTATESKSTMVKDLTTPVLTTAPPTTVPKASESTMSDAPIFSADTNTSASVNSNQTGQSTTPFNPSLGLEPPLYIRLSMKMNWRDFCESHHQFLRELVEIVEVQAGRIIRKEQVIFLDGEMIVCKNIPAEVGEDILIRLYISDKDGNYNSFLTEETAEVMQSGFRSSTRFRNKVREVRLVGRRPTEPLPSEEPKGPGVTIAIVIASVGGVCCVILVSLQLVLRHRHSRKMTTFVPGKSRCSTRSSDSIALNMVKFRPHSGLYNPALDTENMVSHSHPVNFAGLANLSADVEPLYEQFQLLPYENPSLSDVPIGCEEKNRYSNVLPFSETRVRLTRVTRDDTSDYINANYITGYKERGRAYIATQAPLGSTIVDFWRMVWEQQSRVIVMLTPLEEHGLSKCAEYWPDTEGVDTKRLYGDYQVEQKKKEILPEFIISTLVLKNMDLNLTRQLTHLWFTNWPQNKNPEPVTLVKFIKQMRTFADQNIAPVVVHCSPGTGRTGSLIAIDICMRMFDDTDTADILHCVSQMRRERAGVVQTREQYALIYKSLNEYAIQLNSPAQSSVSSSRESIHSTEIQLE